MSSLSPKQAVIFHSFPLSPPHLDPFSAYPPHIKMLRGKNMNRQSRKKSEAGGRITVLRCTILPKPHARPNFRPCPFFRFVPSPKIRWDIPFLYADVGTCLLSPTRETARATAGDCERTRVDGGTSAEGGAGKGGPSSEWVPARISHSGVGESVGHDDGRKGHCGKGD